MLRTFVREPKPERRGQIVPIAEKRLSSAAERKLVCVDCGHPIAAPSARTERLGAHAHEFVNPAGIRYQIGCFAEAPGVQVVGEETLEFTWFPGHAWTIAVCAGCRALIGWRYRGSGRVPFYGLILDRLRESNGAPPASA